MHKLCLFAPSCDRSTGRRRWQVLKLVGAIRALGSPADLISNVGGGVKALVYAPAQGLVQGPAEFFEGVGRGAHTFVRGERRWKERRNNQLFFVVARSKTNEQPNSQPNGPLFLSSGVNSSFVPRTGGGCCGR